MLRQKLEKSKGGFDSPGEAGPSYRLIEVIEYKGEGGWSTWERGLGIRWDSISRNQKEGILRTEGETFE